LIEGGVMVDGVRGDFFMDLEAAMVINREMSSLRRLCCSAQYVKKGRVLRA